MWTRFSFYSAMCRALLFCLTLGYQGFAWTPLQRSFPSTSPVHEDEGNTGDGNRRAFLEFWPRSLAVASCCLTQGTRPSWAEDIAVEPVFVNRLVMFRLMETIGNPGSHNR